MLLGVKWLLIFFYFKWVELVAQSKKNDGTEKPTSSSTESSNNNNDTRYVGE